MRYVDDLILRDRDTAATPDGTFNQRHYYVQDANFNVTGIVNQTGTVQERYEYDAYGQVSFLTSAWASSSSSYDAQYLFTGRRLDEETGIYYYRNRMYHAQLGRFASRDPIGYIDGIASYCYVKSGPNNGLDPGGLKSKKCAGVRRVSKFPPWKKSIWKFKIEVRDESIFEGRECSVDCDCGAKGAEFAGTYTHRAKLKVAFPLGVIPVGPIQIPVSFVGGGEGGDKDFGKMELV